VAQSVKYLPSAHDPGVLGLSLTLSSMLRGSLLLQKVERREKEQAQSAL